MIHDHVMNASLTRVTDYPNATGHDDGVEEHMPVFETSALFILLYAYQELTGDKTSAADLLSYLAEPGMMEFNLQPQGTMRFAEHLRQIGTLRTKPKAWTDYYLPVAHDLSGS